VFDGAPSVHGGAYAEFRVDVASGVTCTRRQIDDCSLRVCPRAGYSPTYASAGTVKITGGTAPITLAPGADGTYAPVSTSQAAFTPGATLTYTLAGAEAPALTASVVAPARPTLTTPSWPSDRTVSVPVSRAQPLQVAWTASGVGMISVTLTAWSAEGPSTSLVCQYPVAEGAATIPATSLAELPAGDGAFSISASSIEITEVEDWRIYTAASVNATRPDGTDAYSRLVLQ
jgi:hypothetical protein